MKAETQRKIRILKAVRETAKDLHRVGLLSSICTMVQESASAAIVERTRKGGLRRTASFEQERQAEYAPLNRNLISLFDL